MYIIGGWDRVAHFGEVLRLDLDTYRWTQEKIDLNLKLAQQSCVVIEDSWMVMYGGKNETDQDLAASTDMLVTRLSALPAPNCLLDKKRIEQSVIPSIASIHS